MRRSVHWLFAAITLLAVRSPLCLADDQGDDAQALGNLLNQLYASISGDVGQPRDWKRFEALFAPHARLVVVTNTPTPDGTTTRSLTPAEFAAQSAPIVEKRGFHERETSRKIEITGRVAHAISAYESFNSLADPAPFARGTNSVQFVKEPTGWKVLTIFWEQAPAPLPKAPQGTLDLYFIDVYGGAATLIVTPEKESILIDSGWPGEADRDPIAIEKVLREVAKLDHLDHMITTHWHTDHYGGIDGLAKRIPITRYWDRGYPTPGATDSPRPTDPLMAAYLRASQGRRWPLYAGEKIPLRSELNARVLASSGKVAQTPADAQPNPICAELPADLDPDPSDNARSLAIRFEFRGFTFLDCGDLTWNIERQLICPTNLIGKIDLFQVTHHGMSISNHPTLLESIQPTVAIINNGPRKGGDPKTYQRLAKLPKPPTIYQLHRNIAVNDDQNAPAPFIVNPSPTGGGHLHVQVDANGKTFKVQRIVNDTSRPFEEKPFETAAKS